MNRSGQISLIQVLGILLPHLAQNMYSIYSAESSSIVFDNDKQRHRVEINEEYMRLLAEIILQLVFSGVYGAVQLSQRNTRDLDNFEFCKLSGKEFVYSLMHGTFSIAASNFISKIIASEYYDTSFRLSLTAP